jgi:hypothetical protein
MSYWRRRNLAAERLENKDETMAYIPTELLTVHLDAHSDRRKVGRLAFKNRKILFEFDPVFLASGIEILPSNCL